MTTPRPPGVRRADDNEEQNVQRLTSPPTLLALYPVARRASLRSHSLTTLQPHCPRQRTRILLGRGLALSARATS